RMRAARPTIASFWKIVERAALTRRCASPSPGGRGITPLETQPQRQLNNPRIGSCRNLAESPARNTLTRVSKFGQVQQIEELCTELRSNVFGDVGSLLNAQIEAVSRWPPKCIPAERPIAALCRIVHRIVTIGYRSQKNISRERRGVKIIIPACS